MPPTAPDGLTCSACGIGRIEGGVCTRCGWASGEAHRCPHCGSVARVEPKTSGTTTTWVCAVCGGPRMPEGLGGQAALASLRESKAARSRAIRARAGSWVFGVMTLFTTLVLVAAWPAAIVAKLVLFAAAALPALLATRARVRAARWTAKADDALERAWLAAAEQVAADSKHGVTAAELAKRLGMPAERADALLTQLAVHDRTRIDVGDDAEVRYSLSPEVMANARLAEASTAESSSDETDDLGDTDSERAVRRYR